MSLQERTLVVKNFDPDKTTESLLKELCLQGGPVRGVVLRQDHAFVEYEDVESVGYSKALLDGIEMFGKKLVMETKIRHPSYLKYSQLIQEYIQYDKQQRQRQMLEQQATQPFWTAPNPEANQQQLHLMSYYAQQAEQVRTSRSQPAAIQQTINSNVQMPDQLMFNFTPFSQGRTMMSMQNTSTTSHASYTPGVPNSQPPRYDSDLGRARSSYYQDRQSNRPGPYNRSGRHDRGGRCRGGWN